MAIPQPAIHVMCPTCHWTPAVLAAETKSARRCLCPHCQHVWYIPLTPKAPEQPSASWSATRLDRGER